MLDKQLKIDENNFKIKTNGGKEMISKQRDRIIEVFEKIITADDDFGMSGHDYGVRVFTPFNLDEPEPEVGEINRQSYEWEDGETTGNIYPGTAAFMIGDLDDVSDAVDTLIEYGPNGVYLLIRGTFVSYGIEDIPMPEPGSILIEDAVTVAIFSGDPRIQYAVADDIDPASGKKFDTSGPVTAADYENNRSQKRNIKLAAGAGVSKVVSEIKEGFDKFLGASSTRLGNVSQKLKAKVRRLDYDINKNSETDIKEVLPLLKKARKSMSKDDFVDWDYARKNSGVEKINELIKKHGLEKEYQAYRETLDRLREEAIDVGLEIGEIEEYAPRVLKDSRGFLQAIEKGTEWPIYTRRIKERAAGLGISMEEMTHDQKAMIVSNMILGGYTGLGGIPATKARKLTKIPPELNRYYMDSDSALMSHIYSMRKGIEARKFFGKIPEKVSAIRTRLNAAQAALRKVNDQLADKDDRLSVDDRTKLTAQKNKHFGNIQEHWAYLEKYTQQRDYRENIGTYILELIESGEIKPHQERIVNDILTARFHEQGTRGIIQAYKNFSYIDTMGSPISALTQIGDLAFSAYNNGLIQALKLAGKSALGKSRITRESVGITKIAQEFEGSNALGKAVTTVFKLVGLEKIDASGKV